jgi:ATP-dependent DNA ligase
MSIYQIIQSIADIGSTKAKQQIMEDNKDNEILKNCFFYAENPRFNFYIKSTESVDVSGTEDITSDTFVQLDKILNREVTGNLARNFLPALMHSITADAQVILSRIVNRDLRCGAGTSIANKVWKNLIPEYPMMLCSKFDEKAKKYLSQFENNVGFISQKKSDGGRCIVKVDADGKVTYHSRNGNQLELFGALDKQFCDYPNTIFDGELLVKTGAGVANRLISNGNYTRAVRGTLTQEQAEMFCIDLWDMIPVNEFNAGLGTVGYRERLNELKNIIFNPLKASVVQSKFCATIEECVEFYNLMRSQGEEGSIIKVANAVFKDERSKNSVKLKAEETGDFTVIGYEKGSGKYADMIGSLICSSSCGLVKFGVGTGMTDEDRAKNPSEYISKVIEVGYNEIISSKNKATKSLFLPVFKGIRLDKNVANSLDELK